MVEVKFEATFRRGGVADYFAVLGVGETLIWQHTKKKIGVLVDGEKLDEEEESEAELMERFYREVMEVAIVISDFDSNPTSVDGGPSFLDEATVSSEANSATSTRTPVRKPRPSAFLPRSPPNSDVGTTLTAAESVSERVSNRDFDGFTTLLNTCPAGRGSRRQDQESVSSSVVNETLTGSRGHDSTLWAKSQVFDANLDPCFGFRADVLSRMVQDAGHTPLKQLGRKVGSTLRHQLGPFLSSRDRRPGRSTLGLKFHLAFRRRAPDENNRPAIANFDLRYVKIHRDTLYLPRTRSIDAPEDSLSARGAAIRRGFSTGAVIAARVAEASKQKLLEKYRERYDASGRTGTMQNLSRDESEPEQSDTIVVALEELIQIPEGFEQWSVPELFRWVRIPTKARAEPVASSSSVRGGRRTNVYPVKLGASPGIEHVVSEDNGTQASDPSGAGVEAYFDGSSFLLTPPSSVAGASDIGHTGLSPRVISVLVAPPDDVDLTTSFEVVDPTSFIPRLLDLDDLPNIPSTIAGDRFVYIPVLALRRQLVGDEERYHEDPAVVDVAVSFRDVCGDPILPAVLTTDDEGDDDVFSIMNTTPWSCASRPVGRRSESTPRNLVLGSPVILLKRNHPIGFADAAFATSVLDRFPLKNYKGLPLPEEELPMFCYPTGCRLHRTRYSDCPLPQYFGFVVKVRRTLHRFARVELFFTSLHRTNKATAFSCPVCLSWSP